MMKIQHKFKTGGYSLLVAILIATYCGWCLFRPLPQLQPTPSHSSLDVATGKAGLVWPSAQAALGISGTSILETSGDQRPLPTASTAKIITALVVLQSKPLKIGQQGPLITLNDKDVAIYNNYVAQDGSVVPVSAGEQISEYQMLQTIMLPSANNMADSLAIWAFGSLKAYQVAATQYVEHLGLKNTHIGSDASGLAPDTVSSAHDLVVLGEKAMDDPVLSVIASQSTANGIPGVGQIDNINALLGRNGIVGIKTGNSDQAGGVFVGAAKVSVNGRIVTFVSAIVGAPTLGNALSSSSQLIESAQANLSEQLILRKGTIVGRYRHLQGNTLHAVIGKDLKAVSWRGSPVKTSIELHAVPYIAQPNQTAGVAKTSTTSFADSSSVPVLVQGIAEKPSLQWRLAHPF